MYKEMGIHSRIMSSYRIYKCNLYFCTHQSACIGMINIIVIVTYGKGTTRYFRKYDSKESLLKIEQSTDGTIISTRCIPPKRHISHMVPHEFVPSSMIWSLEVFKSWLGQREILKNPPDSPISDEDEEYYEDEAENQRQVFKLTLQPSKSD